MGYAPTHAAAVREGRDEEVGVRIRQIELFGFKSFRDHTRLSLTEGLNAVVGPNGCGKSNVADAIRWALGEQSVKHLRAKEMEDVIFVGNAKSPPLNLAEVVLTFEQTDTSLPVAAEEEGLAAYVARMAEFTVKRQIFRSGESHYFINDAPARLRDVTELFLGSGVGPKAYAMIEQGRVTQIVNAKPEELRLFIEEAAGTTLFRSRKIACERKLERTMENLSRVKDVMREIERQLGALRRQAKRAEEFRALEKELRATELGLAAVRWAGLTGEIGELEAALAHAIGAAREAQEAVAVQEGLRAEAGVAERAVSERIERAFAALGEASQTVVRITERQTALQETLRTIDLRVTRGREEMDGLRDRHSSVADAAAAAQRAAESARDEAVRAVEALAVVERELEELRPVYAQCEQESAQALAALNEERGRLRSAGEGRAESAARLAGVRERHERALERLQSRRAEFDAVRALVSERAVALDAARAQHARLSADQITAAAALRSGEEEMDRLTESHGALRESMVHVRGRLDGLRSREQAYDGYADGITTVMSLEPEPRGLVVDALDIPTELEPAVAAVLGDLLRGAIVERPEDAATLADGLRAVGEGRVSLVPIEPRHDEAPRPGLASGIEMLADRIGVRGGHEDLRAALFGTVALADDLEEAVRGWRGREDGLSWVTRAGDVIDRRGIVTAGKGLRGTELLARRRELGELAAQLADDEVRLASFELRLGEAREECAALAARLRELDAQAHSATFALVSAEHAADAAERERQAGHARLAEASSEVATAESAVARATEALAAADDDAQQCERAVAAGESRVAAADQELDARRAVLDACRVRRDGGRETRANLGQALGRAEAELHRLVHERDLVATRLAALGQEIADLERQRESGATALAQFGTDLVAAREVLGAGEREMEDARGAARSAQEHLRAAEEELVRARSSMESERERCRGFEVKLAERRAQLEALASYTRERHEVEANSLEVPEQFDADAATRRVGELKERIQRLGEVNVTAIADARELEERFGFLETQRADLETSMEDLNRTITELSRTTRSRFRETFDRANEKFSELFIELFRGGSASLKLTNPSNLLESGVEIEAQPPGKRVGNSMLSGGERALTAVSLIMALFSLRATPFCLLDEVDAPLDDANVSRFNALLQRMSERTQFIVITHNQTTMESCHSLYGVTMPEPGVSQVVSVSLANRPAGMAASA
ncbi:MAG: chromosome segregation protein SMC [Deltaproteobacteria bacterium]|nr:chromosome segregation protein SMC [Deltaproteobacteria bacterium]